jgi:DNA-binding NarL/FixJ family response regulator
MGGCVVGCHLEIVMNGTMERIRVLVVDDSNLFREALANFVAHLEGVELVGRARDGEEAIDLASRTRAQVIFMDLMMPRLDGVAATRALKRLGTPPAIVICTTYDDERLRRSAMDAGADVFMHKRDLAGGAEALVRDLGRPRLNGAQP